MIEGGYRPPQEAFQKFDAGLPEAGNNQTENALSPFDTFVESIATARERTHSEERGVQLAHPADPFFLLHKVNQRFEGFPVFEDFRFEPTPEQNEMIKQVKLAYGIIAHPFIEEWHYRNEIEHQVAIERAYEGRNRVVLSNMERGILVKIAKAAGIPCHSERSEYFFHEIPEGNTLIERGGGYQAPPVVDADH